ncbi:MAG: choice-of-anchor M domain-containing protein [Verrucomicrobiales bacterium]|nr:choice-of-anchor M domain-containing protein [Verrucomicrobiales bacterium]
MAAFRALCVAWLLCLLGAGRGHGFYHLDLEVNYDPAAGWSFSIYDLNYGRLKLEENPVLVPYWSLVKIPAVSDPHSLYGAAGGHVWLIPESPVLGLPFLGFSAEGISRGIFVNNSIQLRLLAVEGPGHMATYSTDPFGRVTPAWNTRDGLGSNDVQILSVGPGTHRHVNWLFSHPGRYAVQFEAKGSLRSGQVAEVKSTGWIWFDVQPPPGPRFELISASTDHPAAIVVETTPGLPLRIETSVNGFEWNLLSEVTPVQPRVPIASIDRTPPMTLFRAAILVP